MDRWAFAALILLAALLIVWYIAGNEVMRRRARELAIWAKRGLDPFGGKQAVLWTTMQSFRLEVDGTKDPFRSLHLTGLVESWDTPVIWLLNRMRGRRDMILLTGQLRSQPVSGFELYRPGSLLGGDSRRMAIEERWTEEPQEEFRLAASTPKAREQALALLGLMGTERGRLVRFGVRRHEPHLVLALNVPDRERPDPTAFASLIRELGNYLAS